MLDAIGYRREGDDVLVRLVYRGAEYSRPREGSWTQTLRTDFEIGDLENLDVTSSPGDVKLQATFQGARIYVRPTDDASVYEKYQYSSTNYGDRTSIWVTRLDKQGYKNWGFLKFDLGEVSSAILEAKLYLHCWKLELEEFMAACHEVADDGWSERTITWNNKPSHGSRLDAVAITGAGWYTWGITDFVGREFNGDRVVSFCLRGAPEVGYLGRALFDSKEWQHSDRHPYLEITCAPQYMSTGVLTSPAYDAGEVVEWGKISWTSSEPMGTSIILEVSTSNDNIAWSSWQACTNGLEVPSPPARFIRYRATLRADNIYLTPVLHDVVIDHKTLTEEEGLATLRVVGGWDNGRVGGVEKAWLVREILSGAENFEFEYNPSVADAFSVGWIRSPLQTLAQLRQRTWQMLIVSDARISPTDDAYVEELNPNSNFGTKDTLYVGGKRDPYGNPTAVQSYLKFDLSTVSGSLEGACLRAYVYNRSGTPRITAHSVTYDGWSEKSITWNNRPALGSALQELQIIRGEWVSWDITRFIRSELAGDGVAGVGLTHSGGSIWLYSKDSYRDGPYLELAYLVPSGIVVVPFDAACHAAAAMTNVATYPTWRFEFEHEGRPIVLHYAMMPWHYGENEPGFVFQSEPKLEPLT
ncbi:MAG: DNRLRE domain-containing protein [Candidatus Hodarchaeaceae archaeon]|nr:DNRLRE domain-containing protein [Candidatus Hodarchaeaceae archaeon]